MSKSNLWTVFADTVSRFGERTAVEIQRSDSVDRFTYRQLGDMASARAAELAAMGIGRGDRCAILAHNDAHWCAAYLGILKLGAVAVPLDTNYSPAQVATIVRDSGAKVLFVSDKLRPNANEAGIELQNLHQAPTEPLEPNPSEPVEPLEPVEPAVILYTSGTTSDPKGVVLSHANLLAERDAAFTVVHLSEHDAVLGVLPLFHSLAQLANLLLPFAVGARVVYLETINSTDLLRALKERRITIFACVPQFFYLIHQRVMQQLQQSTLPVRVLFRLFLACNFRLRRLGINLGRVLFGQVHEVMGRDMRLLVTGGSKFDPAIGRDLYAMGFNILQAYGLTETSAAATICSPHDAHIDTVGRPFPGIEVRIEADGEIAIRGPIVMQGYHNRPEATAEVVKDGWLMTGDLGRIDEAGRLTITGRKKEMIVLASGKNIFPEEIEAHYRRSSFVKEICVMGLAEPGRPTSERLFAVVVPNLELLRERRIVNAGDILRFEMEGLAVGMAAHKRVLGYDIWFEPLPRTTTQKIKRHEVERLVRQKQHKQEARADETLSEADQSWMEQPHVSATARAIAARVKSGAAVRPDANLELDLGLDSMERVELLTELEQRFAVKVSQADAATIFTVRQLVEAVRPGAAAAAGVSAPDESWATILRDLPPADDPDLGWLLRPRPLAAPLHFLLLRVIGFLFFRVRVTGLERLPRSGPYIISPNHQSYVDPFVLCGVLPYRVFRNIFFVGAVEYFETRFTRWVAHTANIVPVDPDSNLVPAMKAGAFGLSHGKILMLFPEGERSIDGTVKKFKKGSPILARHLGVPIVPVAIKGVYELWPRNRGINWRLVAPWSGHRPAIEIGEPLNVAGGLSDGESAAELRERVNAMWQRI
ncbi:MAG TPA: AMP-binding protein [Vicinamibacterales bacterium]|nr:AMP-binding protein [Vicinamibacterales bacterium]